MRKSFLRKSENIKIYSFYGRANESMKSEVLLPIETNIPKRFFSDGNSNILHRRKCCRFVSAWKKWRERKDFPDFFHAKKDRKKKFLLDAEAITSNNWKHFTLIWIILTMPFQVTYFQLWVYYRTFLFSYSTKQK